MKFEYIGKSAYGDYPSYRDENGNIYFDLNYGRGDIDLYTGGYLDKECGEILGEPEVCVKVRVECKNPYKENPRSLDYNLLARYKLDCDYFLGNGRGFEGHLYFKTVEEHIAQMRKLYNSFEEKPEWLTEEDLDRYEKDMLVMRKQRQQSDAK